MRATLLIVPLRNLDGKESAQAELALIAKPQKWLRGALAPDELKSSRSRTTELAAKLAGPSASSQMEKLDNKRRRLSRGQGPHVLVKPTQGDLTEAARGSSPALSPKEGTQSDVPPPRLIEVVDLDGTSPPRQTLDIQEAEPVEAEAQVGESKSQFPLLEPAHRPGKEPAQVFGTAEGGRAPPLSTEELVGADVASAPGGFFQWLFPHRINEVDSRVWEELRAMLIGELGCWFMHWEDLTEEDKFTRPLDMMSSVLASRLAQMQAQSSSPSLGMRRYWRLA